MICETCTRLTVKVPTGQSPISRTGKPITTCTKKRTEPTAVIRGSSDSEVVGGLLACLQLACGERFAFWLDVIFGKLSIQSHS